MNTILTTIYFVGAFLVLLNMLVDLALDWNDIQDYAEEAEEGLFVYYTDLIIFVAGSVVIWPLSVARYLRGVS